MRKIETEMNQAIRNGHAWSKDNTCITYDPTNNMSAEGFFYMAIILQQLLILT